jgi:hypothetical protein
MRETPGPATPAPSPVQMSAALAAPVRGRRSERDLAALRDRIELLMLGGLTSAPAIHRALAGPESPAPLALSERAVRGHMRAVERRWAQRARSTELDIERGRVIASLEEQARTAARRSALNANDNVGVGYARVQLQATEQLIGLRGLDAPIRTEISGPGGGPLTLLALVDHPAEHLDPREEARRLRQMAADAEARADESDSDPESKP